MMSQNARLFLTLDGLTELRRVFDARLQGLCDRYETVRHLAVNAADNQEDSRVSAEWEVFYDELDALVYALKSVGLHELVKTLSQVEMSLMDASVEAFCASWSRVLKPAALKARLKGELARIQQRIEQTDEPPRLCFYRVSDERRADVMAKLTGLNVTQVVMTRPDEWMQLTHRDILILGDCENATKVEPNLAGALPLHFPLDQAVYLATEDDVNVRLRLAHQGVTYYFIWPQDSFYFRRQFYYLHHRLTQVVQPYRVCLIGDSAECQALTTYLQGLGVLTERHQTVQQALFAVKNGLPNGIVLEQDDAATPESVHLALHQFPNVKRVPVFQFRDVVPVLHGRAAFRPYSLNVILPKGGRLSQLAAQILARLDHDRDQAYLAEAGDSALQKALDFKTGLDVHNIISITDRRGRIIEVNDTFCRVSGYTRDELVGQNHRIVNSGTHPKSFFADMWRTIASGRPWKGEVCNRSKSGEHYWVESTIVPILDSRGRPKKYISIRTDITHLKQTQQALTVSEERLMRSQSFANIGTWEWHIQRNELYWSERIAPMFGGEATEMDVSFDNFLHHVHPDDREKVLEAIQACVETGADYNVEHRVVWEDGTVRWLQERGDVVRSESGEAERMLGIVQDVTERKHAEEALMQALQRAEKADRAKSDFLASMSHELRTPLNAVIGYAELLQSDELGAHQLRQVQNIAASGEHLLALINQLLELSKIEEGALDLKVEPFCLADLVKSALSTIEPMAQKHRIDIQVLQWQDFDLSISVDALRFKQVMLNLLSNAIKYNRPEGKVALQAQCCDIDGVSQVRLSVQDTGYGIASSKQDQVFSAYKRLGQEASEIEGTGIGLSITRKLVEAMGGSIGFSSQEGEGTTFWVLFPLVDAGSVERVYADRLPSIKRPPTCLRVLLMDNQGDNMQTMGQVCQAESGVELSIAPNLALGLERAVSFEPNVVVLGTGLSAEAVLSVRKQFREALTMPEACVFYWLSDDDAAQEHAEMPLAMAPARLTPEWVQAMLRKVKEDHHA